MGLYDLITVLAKKQRWNDASYLSRMIFSHMIRDDVGGEIGYGILTDNVCDAEEELLVDIDRQEVIRKRLGHDNQTFTFNDLIDEPIDEEGR